MWQRVRSVWTIPDLRNKILFTIAMLLVARLAAHVPVPGVDPASFNKALTQNGTANQLFSLLNVFSGGSLQASVGIMGVYPYITASIVVQLLQPIFPRLDAMAREGESGRNRLAQITRYLTVPLALLQAFGQMALLVNMGAISSSQFNLFSGTSVIPTLATLISLTAGTMFLVWVGEIITENGIGNGISLIIFANIVARLPQLVGSTLVSSSATGGGASSNTNLVTTVIIAVVGVAMIYAMVYVYNAQRRVPVQYPTKRRTLEGMRNGSQTTYIPLQVNSAGMIPLIFASSILLLPVVISSYLTYSSNKALADWFTQVRLFLSTTNWWYWVIYGVLVAAFTFFYATVVWEQQNLPDTLQKQGAFIPGIRPGEPTRLYLQHILLRITFGGALFLGAISVAPAFINSSQAGQVIGVAGLLIVVGVVLDTVKQIEAQMVMRNYSGFLS